MIKNLPSQLNEAGKIKIGKKGKMITSSKGNEFRPPKKLDHFQLVKTQKDENDDFIIDVELQNKLKESKKAILDKNGCLIGLPIRLLYNDTELNFPNRYVSYVSGKLSCHGDGEKSFKRVDDFKKEHKCPCDRNKQGYQGKDICKPSGTLTCIIDGAGMFGQAHSFRTTSLNSIKGILGGIELIKLTTGNRIAGLPLMLTMNPKQTVTPGGISTTVYVVSICYNGSMEQLRGTVIEMVEKEQKYLTNVSAAENIERAKKGNVEILDDEEEKDFVEEFFPEAVQIENNGPISGIQKQIEKVEPEDNKEKEQPGKTDTEKVEDKTEIEAESEVQSAPDSEFITIEQISYPEDEYEKLYDRFVYEEDFDTAISLSKRLKRENLIYWLVSTFPMIQLDKKIKKPELLKIVADHLPEYLESKPLRDSNTDNDQDGYSAETDLDGNDSNVKPENTPEKTEEIVYIQETDDSGPIEIDQLRKLVKLKTSLEDIGILRPDKWVAHVNYFLDADKKQINTAKELTKTQGETFISMLEKQLTPEQIK